MTKEPEMRKSASVSLIVLLACLGLLGISCPIQAQQLKVKAFAGPTKPKWAEVGQETQTKVWAIIKNPPIGATGPFFIWTVESVENAPDCVTWQPAIGGYWATFSDPTSSSSILKATFYQGGCWKIKCKVCVHYTQEDAYPPETTWNEAFCQVFPKVVTPGKIIIKRKKDGEAQYKEIDEKNNNVDVLPGELMDLKAESVDGGKPTQFEWTIPQKVFAEYKPNNLKAVLKKNVDEKKNPLNFFWADAGDGREVTCKAMVNNIMVSGKATLNVKKPISVFNAYRGITYVGPFAFMGEGKPTLDMVLTNDPKKGLAGIAFEGEVKVPQGFDEGKWNFTQIVTEEKRAYKLEKFIFWKAKEGKNLLDQEFPYGGNHYDTGKEDTTNDTPGVIGMGGLMVEYRLVESFSTFILFKPKGNNSSYVPLRKIDWGWNGIAKKNNQGKWSLEKGSPSKNKKIFSDETPEHPQWEGTGQKLKYKTFDEPPPWAFPSWD